MNNSSTKDSVNLQSAESIPYFSIVIPAYNVDRYIEKTVHSVMEQDFTDCEIIIVDDCSTDNTAQVTDSLAAEDSRVYVVHKAINEGLHLARTTGTELARGQWILYLDGDDEFFPHSLQKLADYMKTSSADVIRYNLKIAPEGNLSAGEIKAQEDFYHMDVQKIEGADKFKSVFSNTPTMTWSLVLTAVKSDSAKRAFKAMERVRLGRVEDAYEYLVIADYAQCIEVADIDVLLYHWGRGITGFGQIISAEAMKDHLYQIWNVVQVIANYEKKTQEKAVHDAAYFLIVDLPKHARMELQSNVSQQFWEEIFLHWARLWGTRYTLDLLAQALHERYEGLTGLIHKHDEIIASHKKTIMQAKEEENSLETSQLSQIQEHKDMQEDIHRLVAQQKKFADSQAAIKINYNIIQEGERIYNDLGLFEYPSQLSLSPQAEKYVTQYYRQYEDGIEKEALAVRDLIKKSYIPEIVLPQTMKRLGIFCFYSPDGKARQYIDYFLKDLVKNLSRLVIVINGEADDEARKLFARYTPYVITRSNEGLDIAAYREGLLSIGWKQLEYFDEVVLCNDTVLGPIYSLKEMFDKMSTKDVAFWGMTTYELLSSDNSQVHMPAHLQSYWHVYRRELIQSPDFQKYWEKMPKWSSYRDITHNHEIPFTQRFAKLGFKWGSYVSTGQFAEITPYGLLFDPVDLISKARCPLFKRRSFYLDYSEYMERTDGSPALTLYNFIRHQTTYPISLIWDAILPYYNIEDIRQAMHLDYIAPNEGLLNPPEPWEIDSSQFKNDGHIKASSPKTAFIFHVYFLDQLSQTVKYISNLPPETDLYITTTPDKIISITEELNQQGVRNKTRFIEIENRGRDVSALLVGAADVVLNGGYDIIGFAHDKKSLQNSENGHWGSETAGFTNKLMENTLGSRDFVRNIFTLFEKNPQLGLLSPPRPFHALYLAHTIPSDWGPNFEITQQLLENLGLSVPLASNKPTLSTIGSCYWFRVKALFPLFKYGWQYRDFLPEGKMQPDGTISHAIERATGYIVQSQGYYPAWILNSEYARIEDTSLWYLSSQLLSAYMSGIRGELLNGHVEKLRDMTRFATEASLMKLKYHREKDNIQDQVKKLPKPLSHVILSSVHWNMERLRHTRDMMKKLKGRS